MPDSLPDQPKPPFVLLRRYLFLSEALLSKTVLDSANIECLLSDAETIRLDWFWSNLLGGVKLWAREPDAEDSLDLLDQEIPEKFEVQGIGEYIQPRCPICESCEVSYQALLKPAAYLALVVLNLPIPFHRRAWKCSTCRHAWPTPQDQTQTSP